MLDTGDHAGAQSPLAGVILCCTAIGLDEREQLGKWASDMGATHRLDLTSDVTHLVAGQIDTPKYKYVAKERPDVTVVTPAWIAAVRAAWMAGEEPDVPKLETGHRVPPFQGLRICVTGFGDLEQRKYLEDSVRHHGGTYQGDLTKTVTHLVAAAPQGKKYEHARQWDIKTVSLEWLTESVERGMALDESLYDPLTPKEERGKGAWHRPPPYELALGKRQRIPTKGEEPGSGRRKLRRTASTKLGSQSSAILAGISGGSFAPRQEEQVDSWQDQDQTVVQESFSASKPPPRRTELKKVQSMPNLQSFNAGPARQTIFEDRVVHVTGFDATKTDVLHNILKSNGAQVMKTVEDVSKLQSVDLEQGYLVVPHNMTKSQVGQLPSFLQLLTAVNEWWVEKCLFRKVLINPKKVVVCQPFHEIPLKGFEDMRISSTSFTDVDLLHLSKVVRLMGATYEEYTKLDTSVLVCHADKANNEKLKFCADNKIPVVSAAWLWYCIVMGEWQPFEAFLIETLSDSINGPSLQSKTQTKTGRHFSGAADRRNYIDAATYAEEYEQQRKAGPPQAAASRPTPNDASLGQTSTSSPAEQTSEHRDGPRNAAKAMPLALSATRPDEHTAAKPGDVAPPPIYKPVKPNMPFLESDSDDELDTAGQATPPSQPHNTTASPLHPVSQSSLNSTKQASPKKPSPTTALKTSIATLLAQRQQARSTNAPETERHRYRHRRKNLGRAPSNTSNLSAASSADAPCPSGSAAESGSGAGALATVLGDVMPSQALVWGDGETEGARQRIILQMGGMVESGGVRAVEGVGRVRDTGHVGEGVAARVGRRGRRGG